MLENHENSLISKKFPQGPPSYIKAPQGTLRKKNSTVLLHIFWMPGLGDRGFKRAADIAKEKCPRKVFQSIACMFLTQPANPFERDCSADLRVGVTQAT